MHILSFLYMLTQSDLQKIKNLLKQTNAPTEKLADAHYIQKILKKLATKEDIKNFAAKNELKSMAKEVVSLIGAFDQGLKIDIESVKTELREEITSVKTELQNEIKSVKTELNEKMDVMIEQMSKVEKNTDMIPSLKEKIKDHEERIKKIAIQNPLAL